MWLCALAARVHVLGAQSLWLSDSTLVATGCDSFLSSHVCSEKGGVQSCFVAVSWTQAKIVSGDTSETKREKSERERNERRKEACWKEAAGIKRSTFMMFKVRGIKMPSCFN